MKFKNVFLAVIIVVVFICFFVFDAQANTIKVGAAINLTGPASSWGQFHERGQRDYFRYVNEVKGGMTAIKLK